MDHIENYWPVNHDQSLMTHWNSQPWPLKMILGFFKRGGSKGMYFSMYATAHWEGTFADINLPRNERKIVRCSAEDAEQWFAREIPLLLRSREAQAQLEQQINEEIEQREAEYLAELRKSPPSDLRTRREIEEDTFKENLVASGLPQTKEENFKRIKELLKM